MTRLRWLAVLLVLGLVACGDGGSGGTGSGGARDDRAGGRGAMSAAVEEARPFRVDAFSRTFVDDTRPTEDPGGGRSAPDRTLETTLYVPDAPGPFPLVVVAHGFGGHPRKFSRLAAAWAEAGYVVALPAFPLTNDRSGGAPVVADYLQQPADVSFVIDEVLRLADGDDAALGGRVDGRHVGVAGHSLGGATAAGVAFNDCCRDDRVRAAILMDTLPLPFDDHPYRFSGVPVLLLHLTGDTTVPYDQAVATYDRAAPPRFLVTLEGSGHGEPYEDDPSPHDAVVAATTTAFWDAYLLGDHTGVDRLVAAADGADATRITADP